MVGMKLCADILIDRYYRGARVMSGSRSFVLAEEAITLLEKVQRSTPVYEAEGDAELQTSKALLECGLLVSEAA
jgi:hypothetical protein